MTKTILLRQDQMDKLAELFVEADAAHATGKTGIIIGQPFNNGTAEFGFIEYERALAVIDALAGKLKSRKAKKNVPNKAQPKKAARR